MYNIGDIVDVILYGKCRIVGETLDNRYIVRNEEMVAVNGRYARVEKYYIRGLA